jgi:hypothetical protein
MTEAKWGETEWRVAQLVEPFAEAARPGRGLTPEQMLHFVDQWLLDDTDGWIQRGIENRLRKEAGLPPLGYERGSWRRCLAMMVPSPSLSQGSFVPLPSEQVILGPKEAEEKVRQWLSREENAGSTAAVELARRLDQVPDNRGRKDNSRVFKLGTFVGEPTVWTGVTPAVGVKTSRNPETGHRKKDFYVSGLASSLPGAIGPVVQLKRGPGKLAWQHDVDVAGVGLSKGNPVEGNNFFVNFPLFLGIQAGDRNVGGSFELPPLVLLAFFIPPLRPFAADLTSVAGPLAQWLLWPKFTYLVSDPRLEDINRRALKWMAYISAATEESFAVAKSAGSKMITAAQPMAAVPFNPWVAWDSLPPSEAHVEGADPGSPQPESR